MQNVEERRPRHRLRSVDAYQKRIVGSYVRMCAYRRDASKKGQLRKQKPLTLRDLQDDVQLIRIR